MITAVDTNVLVDILSDDPDFGEKSKEKLEMQSTLGSCVISPVVYSETLAYFLKKHELKTAIHKIEEFLNDMEIQILDFTKEDLALSAQAWKLFSELKQIICPKCGAVNNFNCKKCKSQIFWRNHIIADFLIGAHAQNHADVLLTRDRGYYKKYFKVKIIP